MVFRFLDLPPEIREQIYSLVLARQRHEACDWIQYRFDLRLLLVNRQIYYEARKVFRKENVFVRLETPWQEAESRIAVDGRVPLVATGAEADSCQCFHLTMIIRAAEGFPESESHKLLVLLEDVEAFCKLWFYFNISYLGLNAHLRLGLRLQDPYSDDPDDPDEPIPKTLQQRLLLPFGLIKDLDEVNVSGPYDPAVYRALKAAMAAPPDPPEKCLEDATRLKDAGNLAMSKSDFRRALDLYVRAFAAMHIVCDGRRRSVWGEAFFETALAGGPYDGQHGHVVRLTLRVKLVANVVLAHLKLEQWAEARFWGMRSINTMRDAMGLGEDDDDEPVLEFAAASEMGKIYYRTGVACKALDERGEARRLLKVAAAYLPNEPQVHKELASVALRLG